MKDKHQKTFSLKVKMLLTLAVLTVISIMALPPLWIGIQNNKIETIPPRIEITMPSTSSN